MTLLPGLSDTSVLIQAENCVTRYIPGSDSSRCAFYSAGRNEFLESEEVGRAGGGKAGTSSPHPSPSPAAVVPLWQCLLGVAAAERSRKGWGSIWGSVLESRRSRVTPCPLEGLSLSAFFPELLRRYWCNDKPVSGLLHYLSDSQFCSAHQNTIQTVLPPCCFQGLLTLSFACGFAKHPGMT